MTRTEKKQATKSTADWIADVERAAAGADAETRFVKSIEVAEYVRQGDVYVVRTDRLPMSMDRVTSRQLAPGTTQGSRHIAEGDLEVFRDNGARGDVQVGPIVVARGEWRLAHPEHAHMVLPAGTYQIRFQLDERTRRAVAD